MSHTIDVRMLIFVNIFILEKLELNIEFITLIGNGNLNLIVVLADEHVFKNDAYTFYGTTLLIC